MGRLLTWRAGQPQLEATRHDGDYRVMRRLSSETVGWLRGTPKGNRKTWAFALGYNDDFEGAYPNMEAAAEALYAKRKRTAL